MFCHKIYETPVGHGSISIIAPAPNRHVCSPDQFAKHDRSDYPYFDVCCYVDSVDKALTITVTI